MPRPKNSLATQLTRATSLQLILIAGSLSILSYFLGREGGIHQSENQRANLSTIRVSERLSKKLSYPTIINELNASAIMAEPELANSQDKLSQRFFRQLKSFPVDYINYGSTEGSFLGIEKRKDGNFFHNEDSKRFGRGSMLVFSMTKEGKRHKHLETVPGMSDSHEEAWYVDTVKAGKPTWSRIYAWEDQPDTHSISYNAPIYTADKKLMGVVGVDMIINKLSEWLENAWKNDNGLALIIERNGDVVASSKPALTFTTTGTEIRRRNISDLRPHLAQKLSDRFLSIKSSLAITDNTNRKVNDIETGPATLAHIDGQTYLIKATPWGDREGLDWILLTAIAANDEITATQRNLLLTLLISVAALGMALVVNQRLIQGLLTPLTALKQASQEAEEQIIDQDEDPTELSFTCDLNQGSAREILDLNQAIRAMVKAFNQLTHKLLEKESKIIELFQQQRKKDEKAITLMNQRLKTSLEAASIAHEINQPISILRITSETLLNSIQGNDPPPKPHQVTQQLSILNNQSKRIASISEKVRSLLRNTTSERGRLDLKYVIENSIRYINSNHPHYSNWIDAKQTISLPEGEAILEGDAIQLQIAVINLLRNAVEAIESQEAFNPEPSVIVRLRHLESAWLIEVEDNGPGLPDGFPFDQPMATSKADGSGLGLFIVRSAMDNHGGQLHVRNRASGGVLARLTLPITTHT